MQRATVFAFIIGGLALAADLGFHQAEPAVKIPAPAVDEAATPGTERVVLAGGCFWGIQAVFEHVKGVTRATAGYAGGTVANPSYEDVSSGSTGHAESTEIIFDPAQVTFGKLLQVFFSVATDPTELNYQGPDQGTQYRSAIFYTTPEQMKIARDYLAQLNAARVYRKPIVTEVTAYKNFYRAEEYHQDYAAHNPTQPYIMIYDLPKISHLKETLPELYKGK